MKPAAGTWTLAQARALWWQTQGIGDATRAGSLGAVIGESGWLRTLGGSDVYLAARARRPGLSRAELDAAVDAGELRVVPAARGCIYLVPAGVVGDLMALNALGWRKSAERDLAKAGSSMKVVEELAQAVLGALDRPLTTEALRKALPAGAIPSFGEAGKKAGMSSPLPLALRLLEFPGRVERTLEGGRLDSDRYLWRRATARGAAAGKGDHSIDHPIEEEALLAARFLLRELGHARVFTLDTMDLVQERADRIAKLRDGGRKAAAKAKSPAKAAAKQR